MSKDPIKEAVERIINDILDRNGIKHSFAAIDETIMDEIRQSWADIIREEVSDPKVTRIQKALDLAVRYKDIDGQHHQNYAMDQVVRALTGCPMEKRTATDCNGVPYTYEAQGESEEYRELVENAKAGEDGPETYSWDVGTPP